MLAPWANDEQLAIPSCYRVVSYSDSSFGVFLSKFYEMWASNSLQELTGLMYMNRRCSECSHACGEIRRHDALLRAARFAAPLRPGSSSVFTACTLQVGARWGALFQFQLQRRPGLEEEVRLGQNNRAVGGVHTDTVQAP